MCDIIFLVKITEGTLMKKVFAEKNPITPNVFVAPEYKNNRDVTYKRNYKGDAYLEQERGWFEEQGAKCALQTTPPRSVATKGHLHDALEIIYISSGSFTAYINDVRYEVGRGDMLFFRGGDIHSIYTLDEKENSYYVIKIHPSLVFDVSDKKNGAAYMLLFALRNDAAKRHWRAEELEGTRVERTVTALADECAQRRPYFDIAVKEYVASLLLFILRDGDEAPEMKEEHIGRAEVSVLELVYSAMTFINNNYSSEISAADVARAVGMSYSHFSRSFGNVTGQSFKEYLNGVRIRRAEEMLITTDEDVFRIGEMCGYASASYFIMNFKKIKGITPHAYRNDMKRAR